MVPGGSMLPSSFPGGRLRQHYLVRNVLGAGRILLADRTTAVFLVIALTILTLGLFGPYIAPFGPDERVRSADGGLAITTSPSPTNLLGTTDQGYDVLSRLLYGARPTVITGLIGGGMIIGIGMTIGIASGYLGGWVDNVLMRVTDVAYGIPFIPFAIVAVTFLGTGFYESVFIIGLLLWRSNARVLRSQVLQIRERPYVLAAKTSGASSLRIVVKHIVPNVGSMAVLFFTLGMGYSIVLQAGLAFVGVVPSTTPAWGVMVRNAYQSGTMATAWWWSFPPSFLISITVLATFMVGRGFERTTLEDQGDTIARAG